MTLAEICEPIFQYICKFNRMSRRGGRQDLGVVKGEVRALLAQCRQAAENTPGLATSWPTAELVLTFFVDSMILNSRLGQEGGWKPMSHDIKKLGFEEEFWDILEDVLKDPSESATQILGVFYHCIGLGFTGLYTGQGEVIKRKMLEISARLRGVVDADQAARICPEAYENVDSRDLTRPAGRSLAGITLLSILLLATVLVSYFYFFKTAGQNLQTSLESVKTGWVNANK